MGETPRGPPVGSCGGPNTHHGAAVNRNAPRPQLVLEGLILERGPHRQATAAAIGLCRERQGGAAELVVFTIASHRPRQREGLHPLGRAALSLVQRGRIGVTGL